MTNDADPLKGNNQVPRHHKVAGHDLIQALQRQIPADCRRLVIALSGGLDSMVLLEACNRLRQHINSDPHADEPSFSLAAIHVNHQLQPSALAWQQHCQQQCQQRQVPFICHAVTIDTKSGSIEDAARQQRYRVFRQEAQAGDYFVTGHHQDDQLETILMRWLRAASRWGITTERSLLTYLEKESNDVLMGRPFLDFDRQQLEHIAEQWQLQYVQDPSNQDTGYERNWWRHQGIPNLRQRYADLNQKVQQSWRRQQSQLQLLDELLEPHYQAATIDVRWPNTLATALDCQSLLRGSNDLALALVQQWLAVIERLRLKKVGSADFTADGWSHGELLHFIDQLRSSGSQKTFAWSRSWGQIMVWRGRIYAVLTDESCAPAVMIPNGDDHTGWSWSFNTSQAWPVVSDKEQGQRMTDLTIVAAGTVANKKIKPHQRPSKTFKALFQEAAIPRWLRTHWPVIIDRDNTVVALLGIAVKEGYQLEMPSSSWMANHTDI